MFWSHVGKFALGLLTGVMLTFLSCLGGMVLGMVGIVTVLILSMVFGVFVIFLRDWWTLGIGVVASVPMTTLAFLGYLFSNLPG